MLTNKIIGKRIKDYREVKKISQQLMVNKLEKLGIPISRETLSKMENGNRNISAVELKGVCLILDISVDILLKDSEEDNLVMLFKKKNLNEETLKAVDELQNIISGFMIQKKIISSNRNEITFL